MHPPFTLGHDGNGAMYFCSGSIVELRTRSNGRVHCPCRANGPLIAAGVAVLIPTANACAIAQGHRRANLVSPIDSRLVRLVLRGATSFRGSYVNQKRPTVFDEVTLALQRIPNTFAGRRDKAMIALGFAGALIR